jgi:hypothetical protein
MNAALQQQLVRDSGHHTEVESWNPAFSGTSQHRDARCPTATAALPTATTIEQRSDTSRGMTIFSQRMPRWIPTSCDQPQISG